MHVYLSGGMEYADGEGAQWRREIQHWLEITLNHTVFNPNIESNRFFKQFHSNVNFRQLKKENVELYQEIVRKIVEIDCNEIAQRSHYIICNWDDGAAKGAGTKGELTIAKYFDKPVYFISSYPLQEIPGWVLGCVTKTFINFDELKDFLMKIYIKGANCNFHSKVATPSQ